MTLLIADGGSTSTKWAIVDTATPDDVTRFSTSPINPIHTDASMVQWTLEQMDVHPDRIYFYGSGCTPEACSDMKGQLCRPFHLSAGTVHVASDVVGAARALWGGESGRGVACILGTGAIAARVLMGATPDGTEEISPMPALGYILGDEGSGAWLGRNFLSDFLKRQMPEALRLRIAQAHPELTAAAAIDHVYRQPQANRYLASLVPLLLEYRDDDYVDTLIRRGFTEFFRRNVLPAADGDTGLLQDVRFVGSIAEVLRPQLQSVAAQFGCSVTRVLADPLQGMVADALVRASN